jgi:hypothetical protein
VAAARPDPPRRGSPERRAPQCDRLRRPPVRLF